MPYSDAIRCNVLAGLHCEATAKTNAQDDLLAVALFVGKSTGAPRQQVLQHRVVSNLTHASHRSGTVLWNAKGTVTIAPKGIEGVDQGTFSQKPLRIMVNVVGQPKNRGHDHDKRSRPVGRKPNHLGRVPREAVGAIHSLLVIADTGVGGVSA